MTNTLYIVIFFSILGLLAEKRLSPSKKFYTGKNVRFRDFRFKIRFKTFWIDSDQKNFFDQHFLTLPFFHYFGKKTTKSTKKKFVMGKNFRFRDFRFKIRFETFWIDSDQKNFFDQNFLTLSFFHYFGHFGRKTTKSHEKNFTR